MNKIDFAIVISATRCNPNGDPVNNNIPRHDYDGYGEISDVCIKRKIRDRLMESGEEILIVNNSKNTDGIYSTKDRIKSAHELNGEKDPSEFIRKACDKWIDVRSFGQVFGFKDLTGASSLNVRGPVSIWTARSLEPVDIIPVNITKSTNHDKNEIDKDRSTMGIKFVIDKGIYVSYGSIFPQLASLTNFTYKDAEKIKDAIIHMFDNDASSFRPSGSMECTLIWAEHSCQSGVMSSAKVHRSFGIKTCEDFPYFKYDISEIPGVTVNVYD